MPLQCASYFLLLKGLFFEQAPNSRNLYLELRIILLPFSNCTTPGQLKSTKNSYLQNNFLFNLLESSSSLWPEEIISIETLEMEILAKKHVFIS